MAKQRPRDVPMRAFHAEVVAVEELSPSMRRVVFGGPDLAGFRSTGIGDEYVRLLFPVDPWQRPILPRIVDDELDYSSIDTSRLRTYTVRAWDQPSGLLTIDFVVHSEGVAAGWALQAQPGQVVGVNSPTGLYDPLANISWQILLADYAGLPAAARLAETAPEGIRTHLIVEIPHESSRVPIPERPGLEVRWIVGGNGEVGSAMEGVMRSLPKPDADGYIWVAGESRALRGVRAYLRRTLALPAARYKVVGYWTADAERWYEAYDALDPAVRADLERLWASAGRGHRGGVRRAAHPPRAVAGRRCGPRPRRSGRGSPDHALRNRARGAVRTLSPVRQQHPRPGSAPVRAHRS